MRLLFYLQPPRYYYHNLNADSRVQCSFQSIGYHMFFEESTTLLCFYSIFRWRSVRVAMDRDAIGNAIWLRGFVLLLRFSTAH